MITSLQVFVPCASPHVCRRCDTTPLWATEGGKVTSKYKSHAGLEVMFPKIDLFWCKCRWFLLLSTVWYCEDYLQFAVMGVNSGTEGSSLVARFVDSACLHLTVAPHFRGGGVSSCDICLSENNWLRCLHYFNLITPMLLVCENFMWTYSRIDKMLWCDTWSIMVKSCLHGLARIVIFYLYSVC